MSAEQDEKDRLLIARKTEADRPTLIDDVRKILRKISIKP
jgi:hypothetical protein